MNYIVGVPFASIRKEPNDKSEQVDEILHGWPVEVIEILDDFFKIKTFYNYQGYIKKDKIMKNDQSETCPTHIIHHPFANIYDGETVQHFVKETLLAGSYVNLLKKNEKYSFVNYAKDSGYIRNNFLTEYKKPVFVLDKTNFNESELRDNLIKTAYTYMGVQYQWGGKTHMGIDCSGLTFMSYLLNGIILYRDARLEQGFAAKEISKKELKPADLLYFKGHIGMYIGNGEMIHSSDTNGGVAIDKLDKKDAPWEFVGYGSALEK